MGTNFVFTLFQFGTTFSGNRQNSHELLQFQIFLPKFGLAAIETEIERDLGWVPILFLPYFGLAQHFLEIDKIATNSYNFKIFDPDLVWQPWKLNLKEIQDGYQIGFNLFLVWHNIFQKLTKQPRTPTISKFLTQIWFGSHGNLI